jgi:Ca2+/Na+ antiporter
MADFESSPIFVPRHTAKPTYRFILESKLTGPRRKLHEENIPQAGFHVQKSLTLFVLVYCVFCGVFVADFLLERWEAAIGVVLLYIYVLRAERKKFR